MYIVMKRNIIFSLVVFFFCLTANAQIKVRGTIVDDKNEPLIGVNIQEEGTTNGSISDVNGQYSITVAGIDSKLSFSFISYKTIVEKVGNRTVINVTLVEDSELLQEVVVVGYGVQKKSDLTSSISSVKGKEVRSMNVSNATESLQGKVAGVTIVGAGNPGGQPKVLIRGFSTINLSTDPLYVVDGVPMGEGINFLNPNEIESIEVLKDASASAIYGSRASNGVIMVTTRKGVEGKPSFYLDMHYGVQEMKNPYNMADAVIVGKFVGTKALAAVGSTGTIMFLIWGFVAGMTAGFTVLTAQKFGAGDMDGMRKTVAGAGILSLGIGLFLTIVFMAFMKPLLILMNTPEDIFRDAYAYIMIVSGGILAQMLYNLLSSILRALGNSKLPLYFLIISAVLNIFLDLLLIIVFGLGTAGAAIATVVAQGISGLLCLGYIMLKLPILHLKKEDRHVGGQIYLTQIRIGLPMALQYSITAIGTMMVQTSLNILGSTLVAAFTAANKIEQVVTQAYVAMGTTMATYGAQNMGAGNVPRIRQGFKACTILGVIYSFIAAAFVMTVGKYMTYLFVSENVGVIMDSVEIYLWCIGICFIPLAVVNIYRNGIQGLGYGLLPMMAGVAELVGRGAVAVAAAKQRSYTGVCMASPAAWILAGSLLLVMYYYIMKVDMKKIFGKSSS